MTETEERWVKIKERVEEIRSEVVSVKDLEVLSSLNSELSAYVNLSRVYRLLQDFDILQNEIEYHEKKMEAIKDRIKKIHADHLL